MRHFNSRAVTVIASCFMSALLMSVAWLRRRRMCRRTVINSRSWIVLCRRQASRHQRKPVKEIQFTPGGAPARVDPNGEYQICFGTGAD